MNESKPVNTPLSVESKLKDTEAQDEFEEKPYRKTPYRELIGSLIYIALGTRSNIDSTCCECTRIVLG